MPEQKASETCKMDWMQANLAVVALKQELAQIRVTIQYRDHLPIPMDTPTPTQRLTNSK